MKAIHLGPERKKEWNAFVAGEPYFSLLQAWEWGEFKEQLGWKAHRIAVENEGNIQAGAQLLVKRLFPRMAAVGYVARGPVGNWRDSQIAALLFEELIRTARKDHAIFLRMEPHLLHHHQNKLFFESFGFRPTQNTIQPRATIIIDLKPDLEEIQKDFRRQTRKYIHQAVQSGMTVRVGGAEDLPAFYKLLRKTGQRAGFPARVRAYYDHEWRSLAPADLVAMFMAFRQGQLQAVRTISCFGRHAAEFHAGSIPPTPHLYPNHLLVWEGIKWAKSRNCVSYDMWGIPEEIGQQAAEGTDRLDHSRTDGLWGVYRFKHGFGRNIVLFAGAYDCVLRPRLYALMARRLKSPTTFERFNSILDLSRRF